MNSESMAFVLNRRAQYSLIFGFYSQTDPVGICAFNFLKEQLWKAWSRQKTVRIFLKYAREKQNSKIKTITKPANLESIAFHKSIGMELTGNVIIDGIPVVFDYNGS